jgi:glycosyltransferase involved in cell wall biosynthesis
VSVVIPTYNRAELLGEAIQSVLAQQDAPPFELLVIDNNSKDGTRAVVESIVAQSGGRLRYVFEGRQGVSHARNTGAEQARGDVVAFTDDDVRADPQWLAAIHNAFGRRPDVAFVAGRVLPRWPAEPPSWLTERNWGPLALQDLGTARRELTAERPLYPVSANLACRRVSYVEAGGFDPRFQHRSGSVAACEDHEMVRRFYAAGLRGLYEPGSVVHADVQPNRLTRAYHRRWHRDHGRAVIAMLPPGHIFDEDWVPRPAPPGARRLLGVPLFQFRWAAVAARAWLGASLRGQRDAAVACEGAFWEAAGGALGFAARRREHVVAGRS